MNRTAISDSTRARTAAGWRPVHLVVIAALALALIGASPFVSSAHAAAGALLSQGKATTASSTESTAYPASNATDGNTGTRWSSAFSDPQWLQVDLGSTQSVGQIVLNWEAAYGKSYQIQTSNDASTWTTIYSTTTGAGGVETLSVSGSGRYVRVYGTVRGTPYGYSLWELQVFASGTTTTGGVCPTYSNQPNLGPNVHVFDPTMSTTTINNQLATDFSNQKDTNTAQFANGRVAELFKPGTYNGITANVGFYTSVMGLGLNPDDTAIKGDVTVDAFNTEDAGNATQNFWREADNLQVTPSTGTERWAVAQASPFRRMDVHGNLSLAPASNGYASGGYISDTKVTGQVSSVSQQQWYSQNSNFGSWSGSVWNMVFAGVTGAPAQTFPKPPMTVLPSDPVGRDIPYLYVTSEGNDHVFVPTGRTNASGTSWPNSPGTSLPMSSFYIASPAEATATIQTALNNGCNVLFTPGVYSLSQTLNVTKAGTVVLGIGFPTLMPTGGATAMSVADVDGVRIKGLLFTAGTTNSPSLLTVGTQGNTTSHSGNPISVQDTFFRIGGDVAGKATNSLVVNASNTLVDHVWAWRADHGNAGTTGWTVNMADTGLLVNGDNVLATGLFVEHYQKNEVQWNGNGGKVIFFQNENPYDPPNQAAWMRSATVNGYPAINVASGVTAFTGYGWGSYCYFNVNTSVNNYNAFAVPNTSGVQLRDLLTVSLGNVGSITHVVNDTGAATPTNTTPSDVTAYP